MCSDGNLYITVVIAITSGKVSIPKRHGRERDQPVLSHYYALLHITTYLRVPVWFCSRRRRRCTPTQCLQALLAVNLDRHCELRGAKFDLTILCLGLGQTVPHRVCEWVFLAVSMKLLARELPALQSLVSIVDRMPDQQCLKDTDVLLSLNSMENLRLTFVITYCCMLSPIIDIVIICSNDVIMDNWYYIFLGIINICIFYQPVSLYFGPPCVSGR